jgi:hypothetical protein
MIKVETIGMLDVAKINPVLKSASDVTNNSFLAVGDITYLIMNDVHGDDAYKDAVTIKAGEYLNGYDVSAWAGQKLVIDEKHIAYGVSEDYSDLTAEDLTTNTDGTMLKVKTGGKLETTDTAPTSGVYFVVTDKVTLTEKAVKARVVVVDTDTIYTP